MRHGLGVVGLREARAAVAVLAVAMSVIVAPRPVPAQERAPVTVEGAPTPADERSVKCELRMIAGANLDRLANCDSATLIQMKDGPSAIRFRIDPDVGKISGGSRAEIRDMFEARNGDEIWYRFATLAPHDFPTQPASRVVVAQWHERLPEGAASRRPPLAHRLIGRDFLVTLWNDALYGRSAGQGDGAIVYTEPGFRFGVAQEYIYRIVWSPDEKGSVTGWTRDGQCGGSIVCVDGPWREFISYRGPIGYRDAIGYYFKIGLYTVHAFQQPLTIYHAAYARGRSAPEIKAPSDFAAR